jgi:protein ImuB
MFTAEPFRLDGDRSPYRGELRWWAGPWPVDERWWDPEPDQEQSDPPLKPRSGRIARAQVLVAETALLLCYRRGRWYLEGAYE